MNLPFLAPPQKPEKRVCGNAASGTIEIPLIGGLTVAEADTIARLLADEESGFSFAAKVAEAIGKQESITISEAFNVIEASLRGDQLEGNANEIRIRHADAIQSVSAYLSQNTHRTNRAQVTAILRSRLNLPDWKPEDTDALHRHLFNDILNLIDDEIEAEENEPAPPPTDETLGKPPEANGSPSKRTGRRSGGNS